MSDQDNISSDQMDEILGQVIGQGYAESVKDERGCSMGRGGFWMSPKSVVDAVRLALGEFGIGMDDPAPFKDESKDNG